MKKLIIAALSLLSAFACYSQSMEQFPINELVNLNTVFIKQEGIKQIKTTSIISNKKKYPNFIDYQVYNERGFLIASERYVGKDKISSSKIEYLVSGDTLEVKALTNAVSGKEYKDYTTINRFYFDPQTNHFYKMEQFRVDGDTTLIATDLVYLDSLLISYNLNDGKLMYEYNDNGLLIRHERNSDTYKAQIDFNYDESGRVTDYIAQEYWPLIGEPETIQLRKGVTATTTDRSETTWIRHEDFDKKGNWLNSYYITDKGKKKGLSKVLASTREIEYYE